MIKIDREKCNGCGICVNACHEGALAIVNGKAELIKDDYCDGLGNCLPVCPQNAISFEQREAAPYDEAAVKARQKGSHTEHTAHAGCPSSRAMNLTPPAGGCPSARGMKLTPPKLERKVDGAPAVSELQQWPVQIKLIAPNASYLKGASLLIAADCTAYAYGNFHRDFIKDKITLIGCPKLDDIDYSEKLAVIFQENDIKEVTVVRMEVPCCGGIVYAVQQAVAQTGLPIDLKVVTIGIDGRIL